jgi:hypothetical protein
LRHEVREGKERIIEEQVKRESHGRSESIVLQEVSQNSQTNPSDKCSMEVKALGYVEVLP